MGLYLCIFDEDDELDGVEVGSYADFGFFRDTITQHLESGFQGNRYPTLILHPDCDGEWSVEESAKLEQELEAIKSACKALPPVAFHAEWQKQLAKSLGLCPQNLCESFIDVDGEPLIDRLLSLCRLSQSRGKPILFQ